MCVVYVCVWYMCSSFSRKVTSLIGGVGEDAKSIQMLMNSIHEWKHYFFNVCTIHEIQMPPSVTNTLSLGIYTVSFY